MPYVTFQEPLVQVGMRDGAQKLVTLTEFSNKAEYAYKQIYADLREAGHPVPGYVIKAADIKAAFTLIPQKELERPGFFMPDPSAVSTARVVFGEGVQTVKVVKAGLKNRVQIPSIAGETITFSGRDITGQEYEVKATVLDEKQLRSDVLYGVQIKELTPVRHDHLEGLAPVQLPEIMHRQYLTDTSEPSGIARHAKAYAAAYTDVEMELLFRSIHKIGTRDRFSFLSELEAESTGSSFMGEFMSRSKQTLSRRGWFNDSPGHSLAARGRRVPWRKK